MAVKSFAKPVPMRTVGAIWRKSSSRVQAIDAMCEVVKTAMKE